MSSGPDSDLGRDLKEVSTTIPIAEKRRLTRMLKQFRWAADPRVPFDKFVQRIKEHLKDWVDYWGEFYGIKFNESVVFCNEKAMLLHYVGEAKGEKVSVEVLIVFSLGEKTEARVEWVKTSRYEYSFPNRFFKIYAW